MENIFNKFGSIKKLFSSLRPLRRSPSGKTVNMLYIKSNIEVVNRFSLMGDDDGNGACYVLES